MKKLIIIFISIFSLVCVNIYARTPNKTLAPMLKKIMPAVVNISVRGKLKGIHLHFDRSRRNIELAPEFAAVGSGIIVNAKKGYILTNAHVVKNAKIIMVTLKDNRRFQGRLIGMDKQTDIAIIQIHAKHLKAIQFGNSNDLKIGNYVIAIGNPFGIGQTVTSGIISNLHKTGLNIEGYEDFIQTDAPINPGNSGGALVNSQGKLIGMNTAILSPNSIDASIGIGFAIPSNMCKKIMDQIIKYGEVEHSFMGAIVQNITPALADAMHLPSTKGALVTEVYPNLPADKAGLKSKDVIIKINGEHIYSADQVKNTIGLSRPGTKFTMEIYRNGRFKTVSLISENLEKFVKKVQDAIKPILSGISIGDFNQLENNKQITGVQILRIDLFSPAYTYGLRPGDVIVSADNHPIQNIEQLKRIAKQHPNELLLKVKHTPNSSMFVVLER